MSRLGSLASWADSERIAGFRDRVFRRMIELDPDHARARAALKYRRSGKDAPWKQDDAYREPPDWNKGALPDAERRLREAGERYGSAVMAALGGAGATVAPGRREELLERLVDVVPQDEAVRRALGHVQDGKRWALPETLDARARRAEIQATVAAVRARTPEPTSEPQAPAGWAFGVRLGTLSVYGSTDSAEGAGVARVYWRADRLTASLLGADEGIPPLSAQILLLNGRDEAKAMLRRSPQETEAARDVDLVTGLDLSTGTYVGYATGADRRRSACVRRAVSRRVGERIRARLIAAGRSKDAIADRTMGFSRGWILESVGQRLTWYVEGSHGPPYAHLDLTDRGRRDPDDGPMPPADASWMRAAAAALSRGGPARLKAVLTANLNGMKSGDVLAGYGLAAYLIEGRPESLLPFLEAAVMLDDADEMAREAVGVDATTLFWRVRRWCLEQPAR